MSDEVCIDVWHDFDNQQTIFALGERSDSRFRNTVFLHMDMFTLHDTLIGLRVGDDALDEELEFLARKKGPGKHYLTREEIIQVKVGASEREREAEKKKRAEHAAKLASLFDFPE